MNTEITDERISPERVMARGYVTMKQPLEPWEDVISFHRTMALHIEDVTTRAGGRSLIAEDENPWFTRALVGAVFVMVLAMIWRFV